MTDAVKPSQDGAPMSARPSAWLTQQGDVSTTPLPSYAAVKRFLDFVFVALAALPALILIVGCGLAILVVMGRPVFFVQKRTGKGGRIFRMYKLRSMQKAQSREIIAATAINDPRVTPLGRFLRHSHLDELPQLWNIVKGDMTLIGPRPEQPELVEVYRAALPGYDLRHSVVPGLTGWAQVYYGYAADVEETRTKLEHDLYYVSNFGPAIDVKILMRTISVYSNLTYVR
jgi:lipopolysaccharide/colanic/teichoic acid biosynthesis glycosyltransferase